MPGKWDKAVEQMLTQGDVAHNAAKLGQNDVQTVVNQATQSTGTKAHSAKWPNTTYYCTTPVAPPTVALPTAARPTQPNEFQPGDHFGHIEALKNAHNMTMLSRAITKVPMPQKLVDANNILHDLMEVTSGNNYDWRRVAEQLGLTQDEGYMGFIEQVILTSTRRPPHHKNRASFARWKKTKRKPTRTASLLSDIINTFPFPFRPLYSEMVLGFHFGNGCREDEVGDDGDYGREKGFLNYISGYSTREGGKRRDTSAQSSFCHHHSPALLVLCRRSTALLIPPFSVTAKSKLSGHYVRTIQSEYSASRQRTLDRDSTRANFTRGRKSEQVQAACLYIAFRENNKPYLLIDFSNYLRTNVYVLGAVFLQLCKVLRLEEHPIVQKPVDPSLFIYKYTNNLLKQRNVLVSETALSVIASMKRDWMQTGRKPSGLCGAALYMSALAHGFKCSKSDILRIVHVCEATLTKRLVEFENTESASLTIDELNTMAKEHEKNPIKIPDGELNKCASKDLLCEHKDSGVPYFALGLCETCYKDFDKLSGGLGGGLDPPAFQRAERERMTKSHSEESANKSDDLAKASTGACESQIDELHASEPESIAAKEHVATKDGEHDESHKEDESESFSDIDDHEVDGYLLHNEVEKHYRKTMWEHINREYLEEQAAKEAAAAASKKNFEANFQNCSEDYLAARELAASATAAVAKSRKEMKQRRAQEAKSLGPPQSAVEATRQMLRTKRLSSKVNYDRLEKLFDEPVAPENPKKVRFELPSDNHDNFESKVEDKIKDDEVGSVDEFEDGGMDGEYENTSYQENADETYDYEYDGYSYDY
ncbi:hypothetical protein SESBI_26777 [Sesbania bispinosa]|nr:hypothetical protein SESBI_26777 [Sesbania bispinosa]